jgi:diguanylate cyclase (GGDEF)-like protein
LDVIGRYGGDEFLVLLVESNLDDAITIADRLLLNISELSFSTSSGPLTTTLSIGIAELNDLDADLDSLIVRSDQLLYLAKESGRNRIVY